MAFISVCRLAHNCVHEVVFAFDWRDCSEVLADCGADGFDSARLGYAQQMYELGEILFDAIQVGRASWQEEQLGVG